MNIVLNIFFNLHSRHNHEPNKAELGKYAFRYNLKVASATHDDYIYTHMQCLSFIIKKQQLPNLNHLHTTGQIESIVYQGQGKMHPVALKSVEELDIDIRNNPAFRSLALDYNSNLFYEQIIYADDHSTDNPSYSMAFRTIINIIESGEDLNLHIFIDDTYQTVPKLVFFFINCQNIIIYIIC